MHVHRRPAVEALLDEPVRLGWPGLFAANPLGFAAFLRCDPLAGAFEVAELYPLEEAEDVEAADLGHQVSR
ncbi:hypothetical protein [Streptomyces formicae]